MKIRDAIVHAMRSRLGLETTDATAGASFPTLDEINALVAEVEVLGNLHNETRVQTLTDLADLRAAQGRIALAVVALEREHQRTDRTPGVGGPLCRLAASTLRGFARFFDELHPLPVVDVMHPDGRGCCPADGDGR